MASRRAFPQPHKLATGTLAAGVGATAILLYGLALRFINPEEGLTIGGIKSSLLDTGRPQCLHHINLVARRAHG